MTAWTTELDELPPAWTRDDLLAHHAIVSLIDDAANGCLPARFGTPFVDALLVERQDELLAALDRVRGRAELAVTVPLAGARPR